MFPQPSLWRFCARVSKLVVISWPTWCLQLGPIVKSFQPNSLLPDGLGIPTFGLARRGLLPLLKPHLAFFKVILREKLG